MRIYVAGRTGLVGRAVSRAATAAGHTLVESSYVDLRDARAVDEMFDDMGPVDAVVVAAARVGGIGANSADPVGFLLDNIRISTNLISKASARGVPRLVNLGSSCVYPRACRQPMREEDLLTGPFEQTNIGYAVAKVAALELTELYRKAGRGFTSLMPTNLYGPGDTYHAFNSHVIPALIMKFCQAVDQGSPSVTLWGSGQSLREFMHADDLASAILLVLEDPSVPWMNVGSGQEVTIADLAARIASLCGYEGDIRWDPSHPDGTPRKLLDSSRIRALGWRPQIPLMDGLRRTIAEYRAGHG